MGWLFIAALAAPPVEVTVEVYPHTTRPRAYASPLRDTVPAPRVEVVVDGVAEPAWGEVPAAPDFLPLATGLTPPAVAVAAARSGNQLVVRLPVPEPGFTYALGFDPDGRSQVWWRVEVRAAGAVTKRCALDGLVFARPVVVPPRAAPCEDAPEVVVASGEVVEVGLPAERITSAARLMLSLVGPRAQGGTWSHLGAADARPELGLRVGLPALPVKVVRELDLAAGEHVLTITPGPREQGDWAWERTARGRTLAEGTLAVRGAEPVTLRLPFLHEPQGEVELRDAAGREAPRTFVLPLGDPETAVWLRTPVFTHSVQVAWSSPAPQADLPLVVMDLAGRELLRTTVDLPAGDGLIHVVPPPGVSGVRVRIERLAPNDLTATRARP